MRDFFAALYSFFVPMFGNDVDLFLRGMDDEGGFTFNSNYVTVGCVLFAGTFFMVVLFYYIINSVRFGRWYHWLTILGVNFLIQLVLGFYLPFLDYDKGNMASQLAGTFQVEHLWYFGFSNALFSVLVFIVLSYMLRWWSRNCATTPYPR